jgi:hypothetical protein
LTVIAEGLDQFYGKKTKCPLTQFLFMLSSLNSIQNSTNVLKGNNYNKWAKMPCYGRSISSYQTLKSNKNRHNLVKVATATLAQRVSLGSFRSSPKFFLEEYFSDQLSKKENLRGRV